MVIDVESTPELILVVFFPPLIFEAAFHLDLGLLLGNLVSILVLAVPCVIVATLRVGAVVSLGTGLAFITVSAFGTLIAAIDSVAVVWLARSLGGPYRLTVTGGACIMTVPPS